MMPEKDLFLQVHPGLLTTKYDVSLSVIVIPLNIYSVEMGLPEALLPDKCSRKIQCSLQLNLYLITPYFTHCKN